MTKKSSFPNTFERLVESLKLIIGQVDNLGTAAALDVGTVDGDVVQVQTGGKLPALDGSGLTNLPGGGLPVWSIGATYDENEQVAYLGQLYASKVADNIGNDPTLGASIDYWLRLSTRPLQSIITGASPTSVDPVNYAGALVTTGGTKGPETVQFPTNQTGVVPGSAFVVILAARTDGQDTVIIINESSEVLGIVSFPGTQANGDINVNNVELDGVDDYAKFVLTSLTWSITEVAGGAHSVLHVGDTPVKHMLQWDGSETDGPLGWFPKDTLLGVPETNVVAGGIAGDITVTGITTSDRLDSVIAYTAGVPALLTSEFTITGANTINNTGGTNTTGATLVVTWTDYTP